MSDTSFTCPKLSASHRIMLRWYPQPDMSTVYSEVGKGWTQPDENALQLRLLVLDQRVDLRLIPVGSAFPQDHETVRRLLDHPPSKTLLPTHQLTIRQVLVGVAWQLAGQNEYIARLNVLGQVIELVIQPER